jgi:uncharacterized protein (TIGR03067 family)
MLKGLWSCLTCENDGRVIPDDVRQKLWLEFTDTLYRTTLGDQLLFEGEFQVRENLHPHEMDILATDGPFKGQSALGIYEQIGEDLKLAYVMPGKPRPEAFASLAGSGVANTTWSKTE